MGFDAIGNHTSHEGHPTPASSADTTTSYAYNGNGAGQPDTLTGTTHSGGTTATTSYGYDADGTAPESSTSTTRSSATSAWAYESLELVADPGLVLNGYSAEPGTASEDALNLLASWAATTDQEQQARSANEATKADG